MFDDGSGDPGDPGDPGGVGGPPGVRSLVDGVRDAVEALLAAPASALQRTGPGELLASLAVLEAVSTSLSLAGARLTAALPVAEVTVRRTRDPDTGAVAVGPFLPAGAVSPQELSTALGCSVETARSRVGDAAGLAGLPAVCAAARAGTLRWWQVRRTADAVTGLDAGARAAVDERVAADAAAGRCRSRFTVRLRRAVCAAAPDVADARQDRALADRCTTVRPEEAGMAWFGALLAAEDALTVGECLDALADTAVAVPPLLLVPAARTTRGLARPVPAAAPADDRTRDQRRADALVGLCRDALDRLATDPSATDPPSTDPTGADPSGTGGPGFGVPVTGTGLPGSGPAERAVSARGAGPVRRRRERRRGEVLLAVSAETLLGLADTPGELVGHGPVGPGQARRIAHLAGMTWRRVLTDPVTGVVLDRGRETYAPPAELAAHVFARFGWACSRPGCAHRSRDLDHATAWGEGGTTAVANLSPCCRGCHTAKHSGWRVDLDGTGAIRWTGPHGVTGTTAPTDLRPEDRSSPTRHRTTTHAAPPRQTGPATTRGEPVDSVRADWLAALRAHLRPDPPAAASAGPPPSPCTGRGGDPECDPVAADPDPPPF